MMPGWVLLPALPLAAVVIGAGLAWLVSRHGRLDPLEQRRLHTVATPRGGGAGIALAMLLATVLFPPPAGLYGVLALLLATLAGAIEDLRGLRARWRLVLHLCAAALLVHACLPEAGWLVKLGLVIAVAGWVNFVNFMDGANGLIGLQAIVIGAAWCGLSLHPALWPLSMALVAGTLGFLPLNFPRARVFLGDTGSYSIGLATAWLWLHAYSVDPQQNGWRGLLGALPVLVDATGTLLRRFLHGQQWYSAHREHLYQWLIRRGVSHSVISLGYAAVGLLGWTLAAVLPAQWLLPGALLFTAACVVLWQGLRLWLWHTHRDSRRLRLRIRARLLRPQP